MTVNQVLAGERKSITAVQYGKRQPAKQAAETVADQHDVKELLRVLDFAVRF